MPGIHLFRPRLCNAKAELFPNLVRSTYGLNDNAPLESPEYEDMSEEATDVGAPIDAEHESLRQTHLTTPEEVAEAMEAAERLQR